MDCVYSQYSKHPYPSDCSRRAARPGGRASVKGRGTAWSLAHRFSREDRQAYDDGWGTLDQAVAEQTLSPATQVLEERVKTIPEAVKLVYCLILVGI